MNKIKITAIRTCVVLFMAWAFVFLHEEFTIKSLVGCLLISAGTLIMVL